MGSVSLKDEVEETMEVVKKSPPNSRCSSSPLGPSPEVSPGTCFRAAGRVLRGPASSPDSWGAGFVCPSARKAPRRPIRGGLGKVTPPLPAPQRTNPEEEIKTRALWPIGNSRTISSSQSGSPLTIQADQWEEREARSGCLLLGRNSEEG